MSGWRKSLSPLCVTVMTISATGVGGQPPEPTSWISVCSGSPSPSAGPHAYETPGARGRTVAIGAAPASGCSSTPLPVAPDAVEWVRLVPPSMAKRLHRGFLLQGGDALPTVNSELIPLDEDVPPPAAPPAPAPRREAAPASAVPARAMWVWRREQWQTPAALFAEAAAWNVRIIYIAVQTNENGEIADADRLRAFLRDAAARGLDVWAVDGDPRAVSGAGRDGIERRARAIASFNGTAPVRIAGVQYDIEPYLIPGYSLDADRWNEAYVSTIQRLKAVLDLPIELAVPFWWLEARAGSATVMDRVAPWIASVAVMDYRTDAEAIERFARPWLVWGEERARRVRIALEAGPLPEEPRHHFRPAPTGTAWTVPLTDGTEALVLLRAPRLNPAGAAFALYAKSSSNPSAITFFGRLDRLQALLPPLERRLAAYTSFAGIALHEVAR